MWYVYLLKCSDGTLYCGTTTDIQRRLGEHNSGKGAKYTRSRRPVSLLGFLQTVSRSAALKLEGAVRRQPPSQKLQFLVGSDYEKV